MASIYDPAGLPGIPNLLGTSQGINAPGRLSAPPKPRQARKAVEQQRIRMFQGVDEPGSAALSLVPLAANMVQVADAAVQNKILTDVQQIHDDSLSVFEERGEAVVEADEVAMPGQVSDGVQKIYNFQKAYQQGELSDVQFYSRLNTEIRKLKVRYPGYRDVIDQTVQDVTGTRPANALKAALIQEMEELDRLRNDDERNRREFFEANAWAINIFDPAVRDNPALLEQYKTPEGYNRLVAGVSAVKAAEYQRQQNLAQLDYDEKMGRRTEEDVYRIANRDIGTQVQQYINGSLGQLGFKGGNNLSLMDTMEMATQGKIPPEQMAAFAGALRAGAQEIETQIRNTLLSTSQYTDLKPEDMEKIVSNNVAQITRMAELIDGGKYTTIAHDAIVNDAVANRDLRGLIKRVPEAGQLNTLKQIDPIMAQDWFITNQEELRPKILQGLQGRTEETDVLGFELAAQAGNGEMTQIEEVTQLVNNPGMNVETKNIIGQTSLQAKLEMIRNPTAPLTNKLNAIQMMYGAGQNPEELFFNLPEEDRLEYFRSVVNPDIANAIKATGDRNAINSFFTWSVQAFASIPEIRTLAADVTEGVEFGRQFNVAYDPSTYTIAVVPTEAKRALSGITGTQDVMLQRKLSQSVPALNTALAMMVPVFEAAGLDPQKEIESLIRESGAGLGNPQRDRMWDVIGDAVAQGASTVAEVGKEAVQSAVNATRKFQQDMTPFALRLQNAVNGQPYEIPQEAIDIAMGDVTDRPRLRDMIGLAEGASYKTLFNNGQNMFGVDITKMSVRDVQRQQRKWSSRLGSSAAGKYQVMRETLADAIRAGVVEPDEPFDEDAQDRVANWLMDRRGYRDMRSGKISRSQFLDQLAQEWAGIPNSRGISPYAGVGLNKGATSGGRRLAEEMLQ